MPQTTGLYPCLPSIARTQATDLNTRRKIGKAIFVSAINPGIPQRDLNSVAGTYLPNLSPHVFAHEAICQTDTQLAKDVNPSNKRKAT